MVENHHKCIVVSYEEFNNEHPDDESMQIEEFYDFGDNTFELQFLSIYSYLTENTNKWDGRMAFRHGGPHQSSFWIPARKMKHAVQMDNALSIIKE